MNEIATNPIENISSLITFQLGGELFCTDLQNIIQIIDPAELQESDLNSEPLQISFGNLEIPIIDLHKIAGFRHRKISKDNRILILNMGQGEFGIWVEKVDNIYTVNHQPEIEFNGVKEISYLKGILNFKKRKMFLLDLQGLTLRNSNIN
jgi:chemotaxis signal transduction protein